MALITSNGTGGGLASATSSWLGGVVPTSSDQMTILSSDTITLDNNSIVCSDLIVDGVLNCVTSVDSSITIEDGVEINNGAHVNLDVSTVPLVTSKFLYNNAGSTGQVDAIIKALGQVTFKGSPKTRHSGLVNDITAGDTSLQVVNASGWNVGDEIIIESTDTYTSPPHIDRVVISAISGNILTVPSLTYNHEANCRVGNLTSNMVLGTPVAGSSARMAWEPAYLNLNISANKIWDNVQFLNGGGGNYRGRGPLSIGGNSNGNLNRTLPYFYVTDSVFVDYRDYFFQSHSLGTYKGKITFKGNIAFTLLSNSGISSSAANVYTLDNCALFGGGSSSTAVSNSLYNNNIKDSFISGYTTLLSGVLKVSNTVGRCSNIGISTLTFNSNLTNCTFYPSVSSHTQINSVSELITVDSTITPDAINIANQSLESEATYINVNGLESGQAIFRPFSEVFRDNVVINKGTSSLSIKPTKVDIDCIREQVVSINPDEVLRFVGYIQAQPTFYNLGTWNAPTVTLSGLGLVPVIFTATSSSNGAWEKYDISITNTSGSSGSLYVTFNVNAQVTLGTVWFDGVNTAPFITNVRHYGFIYDETIPFRVTNNLITKTEAEAAAITGISIDTIAEVITISSDVSSNDLYTYIQYWSQLTSNLSHEVPLTSIDGNSFTIIEGWELLLNSTITDSLTITGVVRLEAVGDYDLTNITFVNTGVDINVTAVSGVVNINVNDFGGLITYTTAGAVVNIIYPTLTGNITGIVAGSRLQIYNVTTGTEIVNTINSTTSYSENYTEGDNYSTGDVVRIRLTYQNGTTAKKELSQNTIAGSGWAVLVEQVDDPVYVSFAVDGSAITTFTADYVDDDVDIVLGSNFYLSNFYAWWVYNLTTEDGLREFFGGITATDEANFLIHNSLVNIHLDNETAVNLHQLDNRRIYREDGVYPVKVPVDGGGGIDVVWRSKILIAETGVSGLTPSESLQLLAIPTATVLTTDTRLDNLDTTVSSRTTAAQVATALTDYDGPTKAELDIAQASIEADIAAIPDSVYDDTALIAKVDVVDANVDAIKVKTDTLVNTDLTGVALSTEIAALNDFNPSTDTVANVTLVATTTTNTDMRGTDSANTVSPDNASITAILADTNELQSNQGNFATATGFATPTDVTDSEAIIVAAIASGALTAQDVWDYLQSETTVSASMKEAMQIALKNSKLIPAAL
jgi:hypothetical protein